MSDLCATLAVIWWINHATSVQRKCMLMLQHRRRDDPSWIVFGIGGGADRMLYGEQTAMQCALGRATR